MAACYCLLGMVSHMTIVTIEIFMNLINPDDPRPLFDPGLNRAERPAQQATGPRAKREVMSALHHGLVIDSTFEWSENIAITR